MKRPLMYALHRPMVDVMIQTRKDLLEAARGMNAEEMRSAKEEILASANLNATPVDAEGEELYTLVGSEAHIEVEGLLTPKIDVCGAWGLEAETEYGFIIAATQAAEADDAVKTVVYDIDSGGGYVDGCDLAAQALAKCTKPTRADVYNMAASAAYWLASQCDKIVAMSPDVFVGSIGVASQEIDDTGNLAANGFVRRVYSSTDAPNKRPDTSTDEGQAVVIAELDAIHGVFVGRVAVGRGTTPAAVNADFGKGGVVIAGDALKAGMIDKISGRNIQRMKSGVAGAAAQAEENSLEEVMELKDLTLEALQQGRPDLVAAAAKPSVDAAVAAERQRVADLETHLGINADVDNIIKEAKVTGQTFVDLQARISAAAIKGAKPAENPPPVSTAVPDNASATDGWTPEERAKAHASGLTDEEIAKYGPKKGGK